MKTIDMEQDYKKYIAVKKRVKKIKGFYFQVLFSIIIIPIIVLVNIKLIEPQFHWFWFGIFGILFSLLLGWLDSFGFEKLGFGKAWKERKIKELMNKNEF